jgi:hypothetical protein
MIYTIVYEQGGREQMREDRETSLSDAQIFADGTIAEGKYDRIEIRNGAGQISGQSPRASSARPS